MNKAGLLGYAGNVNNNAIVALQVETADCIKNIDEIAAVPGVDILFLGQNDLCMSMGLYEKYKFPAHVHLARTRRSHQQADRDARKNNVILGLFLFGTARVGEFLEKGFTFISIGNDLHHVLDASRRLRRRHGENRVRKRQELEAPPHGVVLKNGAPFLVRIRARSGAFVLAGVPLSPLW